MTQSEASPAAHGLDAREFRRACSQFLTGVTILTTRAADGAPVGITANSFTSVSLDPPMVLVCIDNRLASYPAFAAASHYAVHVLAEDQDHLSTRFALRGADKFAELAISAGAGGVPTLPRYIARFECAVAHAYAGGDHTIFVGRVERVDLPQTELPPLGFSRGAYVRLQRQALEHVPEAAAELWALGWS